MNEERVIRLLEARPFKPFVVYFGDSDDAVLVDDPALAKVEDNGETLIVSSHRGSSARRWTTLIDLRLVASVRVQEGKHEAER